MFGKNKSKNKSIRNFKEDFARNKNVKCNVYNDEYTITIDIDGQKFEMTYGQAAIIFLSLNGIYVG